MQTKIFIGKNFTGREEIALLLHPFNVSPELMKKFRNYTEDESKMLVIAATANVDVFVSDTVYYPEKGKIKSIYTIKACESHRVMVNGISAGHNGIFVLERVEGEPVNFIERDLLYR